MRTLFCALLAGAAGATEPPSRPVGAAVPAASEIPRDLSWDWVLVTPARELWDGDWRSWVAQDQEPGKGVRSRPRRLSGATVVVFDRFLDERKERILDLNATWAPVLARSFLLGWQSSCTAEMLSEFMGMHGSNVHPPTVPTVWYNGLIPHWVQQGWGSSGVKVLASSPSPQPMILYPGRR